MYSWGDVGTVCQRCAQRMGRRIEWIATGRGVGQFSVVVGPACSMSSLPKTNRVVVHAMVNFAELEHWVAGDSEVFVVARTTRPWR